MKRFNLEKVMNYVFAPVIICIGIDLALRGERSVWIQFLISLCPDSWVLMQLPY